MGKVDVTGRGLPQVPLEDLPPSFKIGALLRLYSDPISEFLSV